MDVLAVYNVTTDIVKDDKTKLQVNVLGANLVDAINSANYLKYNGEPLSDHIVSIKKFVDEVYEYTYNNGELNPNYKAQEDKDNENK